MTLKIFQIRAIRDLLFEGLKLRSVSSVVRNLSEILNSSRPSQVRFRGHIGTAHVLDAKACLTQFEWNEFIEDKLQKRHKIIIKVI